MKVELTARGFTHRRVVNDRVEFSDAFLNLDVNSDQVTGDIQIRNGGPFGLFNVLGGLTGINKPGRVTSNTVVKVVREKGDELTRVRLRQKGFGLGRPKILRIFFDQVGRQEQGVIVVTHNEYGGQIDGHRANVTIVPGPGKVGSITVDT